MCVCEGLLCIGFIHAWFWQYTARNICVIAYKHAVNKQAAANRRYSESAVLHSCEVKKKKKKKSVGKSTHQEYYIADATSAFSVHIPLNRSKSSSTNENFLICGN